MWLLPIVFFKDRQVVGLTITGDKTMFISFGVFGHQDTLFANVGHYYFYSCTNKGSVDFIFGSVKYIYKQCVLHTQSWFGAITTQGCSELTEPTRFSFVKYRINGSDHPFISCAWGDLSFEICIYL